MEIQYPSKLAEAAAKADVAAVKQLLAGANAAQQCTLTRGGSRPGRHVYSSHTPVMPRRIPM
eukprot:scaffold40995_cov39-Tisochrysis_lutea.AAC.8